jgi:DNA mismatch repair protein MutL
MPEIKQLPPGVINKIAAGEVIERPASVAKELMENSVDAGATRIDVSVEKGGTELVRVADNGGGIPPEQLLLAVASHATSKIRDADDLFDVRTLGFRGEALASIAEVSSFLIRSRSGDDQGGAQLDVHGGLIGQVVPCGCPVGSVVEVRQLFFNTPVRRKFLRTTQTEMGHVTEAFTRIALAHPRVHFTLTHNERVIHDLPPVERWRDRIVAFFGEEIGEALIPVNSDDGGLRLNGYAANPSYSRANNRMQYLFLNGRHIRDRSLQHALSEAYRGLLLVGRYPIVFFRLEIPADQVDVNVHPTKLEVRFQDGGRVYSKLLGALRQKFLSTDLTATVHATPTSVPTNPAAAVDPDQAARHRSELLNWAKGQLPDEPGGAERGAPAAGQDGLPGGGAAPQPIAARGVQQHLRLDDGAAGHGAAGHGVPDFRPFSDGRGLLALTGHTVPAERQPGDGPAGQQQPGEQQPGERGHAETAFAPGPTAPGALPGRVAAPHTPGRDSGIQIHNRYLITEHQAGVIVIDQHALHERILYEQLRAKVLGGALEKQQLLVPEPVRLTAAETAAVLDNQQVLAQLGIDVQAFGGDTVLVSSYPAMLANFDPQEVLRQIAERLLSDGNLPDRRDLLDEMLHMISCKAAIKAGDRLTPEEIASLLQQRHLYQDTHHCPHGRPTALVFTKEELDKRFKRI